MAQRNARHGGRPGVKRNVSRDSEDRYEELAILLFKDVFRRPVPRPRRKSARG